MEDKFWYLKQINILKCLPEKDLMLLGAQCSMMEYKKGEVVYLPESQTNIYFIKSGSVKVFNQLEDGGERLNEVIETGDIFGKFTGVEGNPDEQVVAVEDCLVCFISFDKWQEFIKGHPALSLSFIKWAGLRLKRLERKMDSLYFKSSRQRIAEQVNDIINRFGKPDSKGNRVVSINLKHEEIAQLSGTSRQNVNTYLNELRAKGYIEYDRYSMIVRPAYFENSKIGSV